MRPPAAAGQPTAGTAPLLDKRFGASAFSGPRRTASAHEPFREPPHRPNVRQLTDPPSGRA